MPSYFLNSSALVKLYHQEPGSSWIHALRDPRTHPSLYLSQLAHVEVTAALRQTGRREGLHHSFVDAMVNIFERHMMQSAPKSRSPVYQVVPMLPGVIGMAVQLCKKYWALSPHPFRSLDAIQLASAIFVAAVLPDRLTVVSADVRLSAIAHLEGRRVINPVYPPANP